MPFWAGFFFFFWVVRFACLNFAQSHSYKRCPAEKQISFYRRYNSRIFGRRERNCPHSLNSLVQVPARLISPSKL